MDALPDFVVQWTRFFASNAPSFFSALLRFGTLLRALFMPLFARVASQPDTASIAVLVVAVVVSLFILDMLRRAIWYWITTVFWLACWGMMLFALIWVYNRGFDQSIEDFGTLIGTLWGTYMGEVDHYQEQADERWGRGRKW